MLKAAGIAALFAMAIATPAGAQSPAPPAAAGARAQTEILATTPTSTRKTKRSTKAATTGSTAAAGMDRPGPDQGPRHRAAAPIAARRAVRDRRGLRTFHLLFRPIGLHTQTVSEQPNGSRVLPTEHYCRRVLPRADGCGGEFYAFRCRKNHDFGRRCRHRGGTCVEYRANSAGRGGCRAFSG